MYMFYNDVKQNSDGANVVVYRDAKETVMLQSADEFFKQLQMNMGRFSDLIADSSGQVISGDEVARIRGIISCLLENDEFSIEISKYRG